MAVREQLEHRALWMYLLQDEAKKKGLDPKEYVPQAIKRCGLYQGHNLREKAGGGESLTYSSENSPNLYRLEMNRCLFDLL